MRLKILLGFLAVSSLFLAALDLNSPATTDTYSNVLSGLKNRDVEAFTMLHSANTNVPTSSLRYNRTTRAVEEWSGSTWVEKGTISQVGEIKIVALAACPSGYLLADGAAVSRSTYAALFTAISTTYGAGNGSTTFNLPSTRGRFPLGVATTGTGSTLGATTGTAGGPIEHTHNVPGHKHSSGNGVDLTAQSEGAHSHTMNHDHASQASTTAGGHGHTFTWQINLAGTNTTNGYPVITQFNKHDQPYTSTTAAVGSVGDHSHSVDLPNWTGSTNSTGAHMHNVTGEIGLGAGPSGDAQFASIGGNPPLLALNFCIKY